MDPRHHLLSRLGAIGRSLERGGDALALLALGSCGKEQERLDEFSDLDFFVIAKPGKKAGLVEELGWLERAHPLEYAFRNTPDGCKAFFADGIYCEFAVFEEAELAGQRFSEGRLEWKDPSFDESCLATGAAPAPWRAQSVDWAIHEALTCLYVGLCRHARGERLSGARFVQNYAVDLLLAALALDDPAQDAEEDAFQPERRIETRRPELAARLPRMIQGYEGTPDSAVAILRCIEERFAVPEVLKRRILERHARILRG